MNAIGLARFHYQRSAKIPEGVRMSRHLLVDALSTVSCAHGIRARALTRPMAQMQTWSRQCYLISYVGLGPGID